MLFCFCEADFNPLTFPLFTAEHFFSPAVAATFFNLVAAAGGGEGAGDCQSLLPLAKQAALHRDTQLSGLCSGVIKIDC